MSFHALDPIRERGDPSEHPRLVAGTICISVTDDADLEGLAILHHDQRTAAVTLRKVAANWIYRNRVVRTIRVTARAETDKPIQALYIV